MRFDEIDIFDDFLIKGKSASSGLALGFSGSEVTWISAQSGPVVAGSLGITGSNYVVCQSVNTGDPATDALTNGTRLKAAYATASNLYSGNRVSVLITPGDYNLGSTPLILTTTNVDLIGLSSDAGDVRLRALGTHVLRLGDNNIDTALSNLTIGTASTACFDGNSKSNIYFRWDNIITFGNVFYFLETIPIRGEFKNISMNDGDSGFYTSDNISGIFENIEIKNFNAQFNCLTLYGTYSNINSSGVNFLFYANDIIGNFKKITTQNCTIVFQSNAGDINSTFEDIDITASESTFYSGNYLFGNFNKIKIFTSLNNFYAVQGISGTFSNIEISNSGTNFITSIGSIIGTFENIIFDPQSSRIVGQIGLLPEVYSFYSGVSIDGTFRNIIAGFNDTFFSSSLDITGVYDNIDLAGCSTGAFYAFSGSINGTFSNIKIGTTNGDFHSPQIFYADQALYGSYRNINIGSNYSSTVFFASVGNISATFENIKMGAVSTCFRGGYIAIVDAANINGTFNNIEIDRVDGSMFQSSDGLSLGPEVIDATMKNITVKNGPSYFGAGVIQRIRGSFENIYLERCPGGFLSTNSLNLSGQRGIIGTFKNITIDNLTNNTIFLYANIGTVSGIFQNIQVNKYSGGLNQVPINGMTNFITTGAGSLNGTFDNIFVGGSVSNIFGGDFVSGTFSNIFINGYANVAFGKVNATMSGGTLTNVTLGTVSNSAMLFRTYQGTTRINGLNFSGAMATASFTGIIKNSRIDARATTKTPITLGNIGATAAFVERCQFYSVAGTHSIGAATTGVSASILFTVIGESINPNITNNVSQPFNLTGSNNIY